MNHKANELPETEQVIALKRKLTELMNENSKLQRLSENVVKEIDSDFAYALQELHSLVDSIKEVSDIESLKSYILMYQATLWDRVASTLGFESIEELSTKGYSVDLVVTPTLQMSYRSSADLEQPNNIDAPQPPKEAAQ